MIAVVTAASKFRVVGQEEQESTVPPGQPHPSRLGKSFSSEGINTGVLTMDGDRIRLTWRGYLALGIVLIVVGVAAYGGYVIGGYFGFENGVAHGRESREREFILQKVSQMENIKLAQEMFPDQAPQQKEKK